MPRALPALLFLTALLALSPTATALSIDALVTPDETPGAGVQEEVHAAEHVARVPHPEAPSPSDAIPNEVVERFTPVMIGVAGLVGAVAAFALGTRFVSEHDALRSPVRREMYALIQREPGLTQQEITRRLGLTTTNAIWHLQKLEASGLVHYKRWNARKAYLASAGGAPATRVGQFLLALRTENARRLLRALATMGETTEWSLATRLRVNKGTIRWHAQKLVQVGLIARTVGEPRAYDVTPLGREALREARLHPERLAHDSTPRGVQASSDETRASVAN